MDRALRIRAALLCRLDDRIDDVGLVSGFDLFAHESPDLFGLLVITRRVVMGVRPGGSLVERAGVEVAVEGECERARDGRGGHNQGVRFGLVLLHQPEALHHAEAVLLVHDDEADFCELDFFFDERVRADHQVRVARAMCRRA